MRLFLNRLKDKRKLFIIIFFVIAILITSWIVYQQINKPEKIVKEPIKKNTYSLSSISLSIKKNGYLFMSKDNGYKKLKLAIEDVLNNITNPALESNTIPEDSNKENKNTITVNQLKEKTVSVGSIIYIDGQIKTKLKVTPELEKLGSIDDQGNLVIPAHEFLIVLSGEYSGLLLIKSNQDTDRWSAWEVKKESIQHLIEMVRQGIK